MKALKKTECACERCQQACRHTPGWFRPGEMEKAAKLLKMTPLAFFKKYIGVNWWCATPDIFVMAPRLASMKGATEYPANPKGTCVFFSEGRCAIHAAKPYECAHGNPCQPEDTYAAYENARERTATLWKRHQGAIIKLMGRKPRAKELGFLEGMFL